ncbi:MAG: alpha/beta hydrolase [Parvularculaceae bacterium]
MSSRSTAFVLVHGAWWAGDWLWEGVSARLRAEGHRVFTPVLTGLGPRAHQMTPAVNLSAHILDIVNLIKWEELTDIVLVGHSYAGMVISGVAEKVPQGTIRSIVYLDAFLPENGQSLGDMSGNAEPAADENGLVPPPDWFAGDDENLRALLKRRGTPQSPGCFREPVSLSGARDRVPVKTYVLAKTPVFTQFYEKTKADPAWRTETIACGHMTMIEKPEETAEIILRATR